jgi:PBP1b-binding outer membrane lipoprotein LpoB
MKKKMLLIVSIAMLTFGLLAGCSSEGYEEDPNSGNEPKAPSENPSSPTEQPTEPTAPEEPADGEGDQDSTETDQTEKDSK